ncbi:hypothetical protein [Cryobacterium sp. PAMC25264]|uniref:hypothetical protein n=1 Tax=Cryobacterium sp. PAMC25264 TaxID=2861288 RepID=UPI001C63536C|nr:hypothetical protein [Cryobacterium sp. PAMC25264]QYF73127.1 hypothetical protein KY500_15430 [Cryobacterium sp. PAMC25264]
MSRAQRRSRTLIGALGILTATVGLTACSSAGGPAAGGTPASVPSASATPTAARTPTAAPTPTPVATWNADASAKFAGEVFPITGTDQYVFYTNSQVTAAQDSGSGVAADVAPGSYELRLACQGGDDNSITITASSPGVEPTEVTASCDETIQSVPFTMVNTGATLNSVGTGTDPVLWAAVIATLPGG